MECLSPIKIVNPTKYVSLKYADRMVQYCRCGKCANCQRTAQNEWYFRANYESRDCISRGGYVLFDGLSYAPAHVPRLSEYFPGLPSQLDWMCFDYQDIRLFLVRLRRYLEYRDYDVKDNLRYFCSTEYGVDNRYTHRPHVHILFFCNVPGLDSITLSNAVAQCWSLGRTDGAPYKGSAYVRQNTFTTLNYQRVCKYVAKYVMKDSAFQKTIDKRLYSILRWQYNKYFYSIGLDFNRWINSHQGRKVKSQVKRYVNQFHLQSLHFGESALRDIDLNEVMDTNLLKMLDNKQIVMRIGLPMYYKRKLFYECKKINGCYAWLPTDLGKRYLAIREKQMLQYYENLYRCAYQYGVNIANPRELSQYVVSRRGRIKLGVGTSTIEDRLTDSDIKYSYITPTDRDKFGMSFITDTWLGNCKGYNVDYVDYGIPLSDFLQKHVYFDSHYEKILEQLDKRLSDLGKLKQAQFDNEQRVRQVFKSLEMI